MQLSELNTCETLKNTIRERNPRDLDEPKVMMKHPEGCVDRYYTRILTILNDSRVKNIVQSVTSTEEVESDVRSTPHALKLPIGEDSNVNECVNALTSEIGMPAKPLLKFDPPPSTTILTLDAQQEAGLTCKKSLP